MDLTTLKQIRKDKKLRLEFVASVTGVSRSTLIDIEGGTGNPSFKAVRAVVEYLGYELKLQVK